MVSSFKRQLVEPTCIVSVVAKRWIVRQTDKEIKTYVTFFCDKIYQSFSNFLHPLFRPSYLL
jgi:hypothetical protein